MKQKSYIINSEGDVIEEIREYPDFDPEKVKEYNNIPEEDLRAFYKVHKRYPPTNVVKVMANGWIDDKSYTII